MSRNWIKQFLRFCVVGLLSTICHVGTLITLVEVFKTDPIFAASIGFLLAVITSFVFNSTWTYEAKTRKKLLLFFRYVVVCAIGFTINFILMFTLINIMHLWYLLSQLIVIIVVTPTNFILNKVWTFKATPTLPQN